MEFEATAGVWATHNLLISYEHGLANIRDRVSSRAMNVRRALKDIKYIRRRYLTLSRDVQAVSSDIATLAKSGRNYARDTLDFSPPVYLQKAGAGTDFIQGLRVQDEARAKQLDAIEAQVGKTVLTSGDLATAVANIRIQRYVFWLTVIIAIFTLVSIFKH
jgi:hypothetical protein